MEGSGQIARTDKLTGYSFTINWLTDIMIYKLVFSRFGEWESMRNNLLKFDKTEILNLQNL